MVTAAIKSKSAGAAVQKSASFVKVDHEMIRISELGHEWPDSDICIPIWQALLQMSESKDH